jgi:hypothetical protein
LDIIYLSRRRAAALRKQPRCALRERPVRIEHAVYERR